MIYPIVRVYATTQQANDALARLRSIGCMGDTTNVVAPSAGSTEEAIVAAITSGYVLRSDARLYAQAVRRGLTLVSVRPPFGMTRTITDILEAYGPVDSGVQTEPERAPLWDEAAPFSSMLGLPALAGGATPFSSLFFLPAVTSAGGTTGSALGLPELADSDFAVFGEPQLSDNPAPFSSLLKLPV